eukprot:scaffold91553_cov63-Phaeocystis_antarctica.AAC.2
MALAVGRCACVLGQARRARACGPDGAASPAVPRYAVRAVRRGWDACSVLRLGASCPAPPVRTARRRLVRVAHTYSTQAPGRTCQHRPRQLPVQLLRLVARALDARQPGVWVAHPHYAEDVARIVEPHLRAVVSSRRQRATRPSGQGGWRQLSGRERAPLDFRRFFTTATTEGGFVRHKLRIAEQAQSRQARTDAKASCPATLLVIFSRAGGIQEPVRWRSVVRCPPLERRPAQRDSRKAMLSLFAAAASFTAPPSMVGQNVQLRRSAAPQMAVVFKAGDTVQMITGDSKGAPACMAKAGCAGQPERICQLAEAYRGWRPPRPPSLLPLAPPQLPKSFAESALRLARVTAFAPMLLHGAPSCAALSGARPFAAPKHRLRQACSGRHAASLTAPQHHDLCHHLSDPPLLTVTRRC